MLSRRRMVSSASAAPIVEKRLAAFAMHHLPALFTGLDTDKVFEDLSFTEREDHQKVKITQVVILLCLNIGNDPPDQPRIEPCARVECWIDPHVAPVSGVAAEGSIGSIADALEKQYLSLGGDVVFKKATEVCLGEAKHLMGSARRRAEKNRVLLHYNGHGMPRATSLGEIWFFDKNRTHYVPLNILEMAHLLDSPTLYVLDCNSAGSILQHWYKEHLHERRPHDIILCACGIDTFLPLNPQLPADVLTSCLTTPLCMALEWYISYSHRKHLLPHVTAEMIRNIPGDLSDQNSPRGELNRILVAVTDTIAWCTSPPSRFYHLFRQDSMTTTLLRNFFLADRLLREVGCVPVAHPPISEEAHLHHAWDLWEYTLENVISQLPELLTPELRVNPNYRYRPSTFFVDQLMAFEVWVETGNLGEQPEELPSVLLALTQSSYCVPALTLLVKYLDSGMDAGKRAIDCGILPHAKNLLCNAQEVLLIVCVLWMQLVRADIKQCTAGLLKWRLGKYFIRVLELDEKNTKMLPVEDVRTALSRVSFSFYSHVNDSILSPANDTEGKGSCGNASNVEQHYFLMKELNLNRCKAMACYILCQLLKGGGEYMCLACWNNQLLNAAFSHLASPNAEVRSWSCLVLAQLFLGLRHARNFASRECTTHFDLFTCLLQDKSPIVRSSCVTLLASLVGSCVDHLPVEQQIRLVQMEKSLLIKLRCFIYDASMSVREELIFFACRVLFHYGSLVTSLHSSTSPNQYMEYIQDVGKNAAKWVLDEPDVQVKSQLSASRPTVNSRFDHSVVFNINFLTRDDPAVFAEGFDLAAVDSSVQTLLQGMVHDAAMMLFILHQTCDTSKVAMAVDALSKNSSPRSYRFTNEALRSMCWVLSTDSSHFLSEADRARSTRNADSMQQLVLDMQERKLEPPLLPSGKGRTLKMENGVVALDDGEASKSAFLRYQVLPSLIPGEQVICATFRALELEMVLATKNQQIYHTSYETYSAQTYIHHFSFPLTAPLHDILVINDLSEQAGLLLVDKRGSFSLVKDCWKEMRGMPTEVAKFSACPPDRTVDIKSVYRSYNANLFYGGPIGSNGGTEIHVLSLNEEQVIQRLTISGDTALMSLTAHTTAPAVFAGCADGVVRYYDDRQKQGFLGVVGLLHPRGASATNSLNVEAVIGAGPVETGATLTIATATRSAMRLFDSRKVSEPILEVDVSTLCGLHGKWPPVPRPPSICAFSAGVHTGLLGALLSDGTYVALNVRGRPLLEKPIKVSNAHGVLLPGGFAVHPLRPLMSVGGEILSIH